MVHVKGSAKSRDPIIGPKLAGDEALALAAILSDTHDGIIVTDKSLNVLAFGKGAEKIFGYTRDEIFGFSIGQLIPHLTRYLRPDPARQGSIASVNSGKTIVQSDITGLHADGTEVQIEIAITRKTDAEKELVCIIVRDVSARLEQQRVLKKARDDAEWTARVKTNFLATMSHEIRTPLHGVLGTLQLLKRGLESEEQLRLIRTAEDAGLLLRGVIDDILDLTRVESGFLLLEPQVVELHHFIESVADGFRLAASNKGLEFALSIDDRCPAKVYLDPQRVKQVLSNLIGNALKFTEVGRIDLRVVMQGADLLHVSVNDTGIGIEQDNLFDIFEQYSQSNDSIQRQFGGTGLGLSIVRSMVSLMDGKCGVQSWIGRGSNFWITIPVGSPDEVAPDLDGEAVPADDAVSEGLTEKIGKGQVALVVDDTPTNQEICLQMLNAMGFEALACGSGAEALKLLRDRDFDLVLLDLHMPLMSGAECLRKIRARADRVGQIPVIMISADVGVEAVEAAHLSRANAFCPKPFDYTLLASIIAGCFAGKERHIVLIDDDPDEFEILSGTFSELNRKVKLEYYRSAEDFCRKASISPDTCVLLDGKIPPSTCHQDSLKIMAEHGIDARIYLISSGRFTALPKVGSLNVVAKIDKCDLITVDQARLFVDRLDAS